MHAICNRVLQDVLGRFSGQWELRPVVDPSSGLVVGCRGELNQDVLPKGKGRRGQRFGVRAEMGVCVWILG